MDHPIPVRRPDLSYQEKSLSTRRFYQRVDFTVPAGHRVKIKESVKFDKYPDLAREQKNCGK